MSETRKQAIEKIRDGMVEFRNEHPEWADHFIPQLTAALAIPDGIPPAELRRVRNVHSAGWKIYEKKARAASTHYLKGYYEGREQQCRSIASDLTALLDAAPGEPDDDGHELITCCACGFPKNPQRCHCNDPIPSDTTQEPMVAVRVVEEILQTIKDDFSPNAIRDEVLKDENPIRIGEKLEACVHKAARETKYKILTLIEEALAPHLTAPAEEPCPSEDVRVDVESGDVAVYPSAPAAEPCATCGDTQEVPRHPKEYDGKGHMKPCPSCTPPEHRMCVKCGDTGEVRRIDRGLHNVISQFAELYPKEGAEQLRKASDVIPCPVCTPPEPDPPGAVEVEVIVEPCTEILNTKLTDAAPPPVSTAERHEYIIYMITGTNANNWADFPGWARMVMSGGQDKQIRAWLTTREGNAPQRTDSERLEWMAQYKATVYKEDGGWWTGYYVNGKVTAQSPELYPTLRAAIDAAMQAERDEEAPDGTD